MSAPDWLPDLIAGHKGDPSGLQWSVADRLRNDDWQMGGMAPPSGGLAKAGPSVRARYLDKAANLITQHGERSA